MTMQYIEFSITLNNIKVDAIAHVDYEPYSSAKIVGLPENCYPAEEGTLEIHSLMLSVKDSQIDITYLLDEIPSLKEDIIQEILTNIPNP